MAGPDPVISVEEALDRLLALARILDIEEVPLRRARGRVLAQPLVALHDQPPFAASAMDGYAISGMDAAPGDAFAVIGNSAAGHPFTGRIQPEEAVRIFTGAPVPDGASRVIVQEDVRREGERIVLTDGLDSGTHIRPAAGDFARGETLSTTRALGSRDIALLAAMGFAAVPVRRRSEVAILMTGDELRVPGASLSPGQITASNGYGLAAMLEAAGAAVRILPIARDTGESLAAAIALAHGADLLLTIGGASVGDHDLVAGALGDAGTEMSFHRIAMRPGKPLMAGKLDDMTVIGLPGNPVSAMVCGVIFVLPILSRMLGLPTDLPTVERPLAAPVDANGPRQHYMRGRLGADGKVTVADRQDSSLLRVLQASDVLVVRPPGDRTREAGDIVTTIPLPD